MKGDTVPYQPYQPSWAGAYGQGFSPTYQPIMTPVTTTAQPQQFQQPVHGFVYVNGIEGARAYQMGPNSEMPLFDSNPTDLIFIKTTDGAGYPTITVVKGIKQQDNNADPSSYVTRDELEKVYADIASQIEALKGAMNVPVPTTASTPEPDALKAAGDKADGRRRP